MQVADNLGEGERPAVEGGEVSFVELDQCGEE
jgi:hypothetical protein